jgi:pyridoxine 5-phosphate synthase
MERLISGAVLAHEAGLVVNAGHGINLDTLPGILRIPHLDTLNIGHSIIAHAVFVGLENAVHAMLDGMSGYNGGERS